jgi:hypothetical protein
MAFGVLFGGLSLFVGGAVLGVAVPSGGSGPLQDSSSTTSTTTPTTMSTFTTSTTTPTQTSPGKGCGDKNHLHDRRSQCKIKISDVKMNEGNSGTTAFDFTVSLSDVPLSEVAVVYTTAGGTARPLEDFVSASGTLSFLPGVTTQTVTVPVVGDTAPEADETFYVNLSSPSANAYIADSQGVGAIVNDD